MSGAQKKYVYLFDDPLSSIKDPKGVLGGKGVGLADMTQMGLPIPYGFIVSTQAFNAFQAEKKWPAGLKEQVNSAIAALEKKAGKKFGDKKNPLLVSIRSGARVSM